MAMGQLVALIEPQRGTSTPQALSPQATRSEPYTHTLQGGLSWKEPPHSPWSSTNLQQSPSHPPGHAGLHLNLHHGRSHKPEVGHYNFFFIL